MHAHKREPANPESLHSCRGANTQPRFIPTLAPMSAEGANARFDPERFRAEGHRLIDWLAEHWRSIAMPSDVYPVYRQISARAGVTRPTA